MYVHMYMSMYIRDMLFSIMRMSREGNKNNCTFSSLLLVLLMSSSKLGRLFDVYEYKLSSHVKCKS